MSSQQKQSQDLQEARPSRARQIDPLPAGRALAHSRAARQQPAHSPFARNRALRRQPVLDRLLPRRDPQVPLGINTAIGSAVMVLALVAADLVPAGDGMARLGLLCAVLAWFALASVDPAAVLVVLVVTCLVGDGFLVNHGGELSWHGGTDAARVAMLAGAGLLGLVAGQARRRLADHRRFAVVREWS